MSYKNRLKQLSEQYAKAQANSRGSSIPEGDYVFKIQKAGISTNQDSVAPTFILKVATGEHAGKTERKMYVFTTKDGRPNEIGMSIFKEDMRIFGIESNDIERIEEDLNTTVGALVKGRVVANKTGRTSVYLNQVIEDAPDDEYDDVVDTEEEVEELEEPEEPKPAAPRSSKKKSGLKVKKEKPEPEEDEDDFDSLLAELED